MSFQLFDCSPPLYCWAEGGHICVREIDDTVSLYACNLGFFTKPQLVPFVAVDAVWVLRHEGVLFVGRNDGTFSGFRESDGLLVRFGIWDYPRGCEVSCIGQMGGMPAYIDSRNMRAVYISPLSNVYMFNKPFDGPIYEYKYLWEMLKCTPELTIPTRGGFVDVSTAGTWISAPEASGRDSPLFL